MVGSRQITLSVFRQLDVVFYEECVPFGRVNDHDRNGSSGQLGWIVGRQRDTGVLVRANWSSLWDGRPCLTPGEFNRLEYLRGPPPTRRWHADGTAEPASWSDNEIGELAELEKLATKVAGWQAKWKEDNEYHRSLPLIVLAGLK